MRKILKTRLRDSYKSLVKLLDQGFFKGARVFRVKPNIKVKGRKKQNLSLSMQVSLTKPKKKRF